MNFAQRPSDAECFDYHRDYVANVPDGNIVQTLTAQQAAIDLLIAGIREDQAGIVHPPFGWTIRQVIEHCTDGERVFGYRALRFASGDATPLPGWDENQYAASGYGPRSSLAELGAELTSLRRANVVLLSRLTPAAWNAVGTADGRRVSVRTLAWLMAGHWLHHERILRQRLGLVPSASSG